MATLRGCSTASCTAQGGGAEVCVCVCVWRELWGEWIALMRWHHIHPLWALPPLLPLAPQLPAALAMRSACSTGCSSPWCAHRRLPPQYATVSLTHICPPLHNPTPSVHSR